MKNKFLDNLDGGWGDIVSDTYEENAGFIAEPQEVNGIQCIYMEQYKNDTRLNGTVIIPKGVKKLYFGAFMGCPLLTVIFPSTLTGITSSVFAECTNLKTVIFNEGLLSIDIKAFNKCESLKDISLPDSLIYIGDDAFSYTSLETIKFPKNLKIIRYNAFNECNLQGNLILPEKLEVIGQFAFANNRKLNGTLKLPLNLDHIAMYAFSGCNFTGELRIPPSVDFIGTKAFAKCKFTTIYVKAEQAKKWPEDWNNECSAEIIYY